jgi:PPP family 3-phenylpropionic acid transporter
MTGGAEGESRVTGQGRDGSRRAGRALGRSGARREARAGRRPLRTQFAISGAAAAALLPFFALRLRDRGLGPERIGLVLAAASLAGALVTPVWSHVADTRAGIALVLRLSAFATAVWAVLLAFTGSSFVLVLVIAAAMSACSAPGAPLSDALAVGYLGPGRVTEYGTIRLWASAGWGVAVIGFGALFGRVGLGPSLPLYALGNVVLALWTLCLPPGAPLPHPSHSRLGAIGDALHASPTLVPFLVGVFLVAVASSAAWSFVGLRIVGQGGGPFLVGLAAGLTAFVEIPVMQNSGALGRRFGLRAMFGAGALVYALVFLAWSLARSPLVITLVASADGVAFALVYTGMVVITGRLVPERLSSTGQALAQTANRNVAPIVGAAVGGVVFARLGAPALFAGAAALAVAGAVVVWVVLGPPPPSHPPEAEPGTVAGGD